MSHGDRTEIERRARELFDDSVERLDGETRSRLNRARQADSALQQRRDARHGVERGVAARRPRGTGALREADSLAVVGVRRIFVDIGHLLVTSVQPGA